MSIEILEKLNSTQQDEVLEFLVKWNPDHPELGNRDKLIWQNCVHLLSRYHGALVGYMIQIKQIFKYGKNNKTKEPEHVCWGVSIVLDMSGDTPKDDRRRVATTHELLSNCDNILPWRFFGAGMTPEIQNVYIRRGLSIRKNSVNMFTRLISPSKALRYQNKPQVFSPIIKTANIYYSKQRYKESNFTEIVKFNPEWDTKWDTLLGNQYELYGERNSEYLNHKLDQPDKQYLVFLHKDGGYIIFRPAKHKTKDLFLVKICDLVGTDETKKELIAKAVDYAYEIRAHGIVSMGYCSEKSLFKKAGMYISKQYPVAVPVDVNAKIHLSFFDADLDNLW